MQNINVNSNVISQRDRTRRFRKAFHSMPIYIYTRFGIQVGGVVWRHANFAAKFTRLAKTFVRKKKAIFALKGRE